MTKPKTKKQFSPHIYAEWGELFDELTIEQKAEVLTAITKYPNYEPKNIIIWKFIKSQLDKDYEMFTARCKQNGDISRNYWDKMKANDTERIPNDTERYPKRITNNDITDNELQITETDNKENIYTQEEFLKFFLKEYEKVFINIPMVSNEMKDKIREIYSNNPTVTDRLPTLFKELKETKFEFKNKVFKPDITWLLKENNFYKLANGGLKLEENKEKEIKTELSKRFEKWRKLAEEREENE